MASMPAFSSPPLLNRKRTPMQFGLIVGFPMIDDVAGGHTFTPSDGTDLGEMGISRDIGDWLPAGDLM